MAWIGLIVYLQELYKRPLMYYGTWMWISKTAYSILFCNFYKIHLMDENIWNEFVRSHLILVPKMANI